MRRLTAFTMVLVLLTGVFVGLAYRPQETPMPSPVVKTVTVEVPVYYPIEIPVYLEKEPKDNILTYSGEFYITAYCSCPKCCGVWASKRPVVRGKSLVITASGSYAEQGITIAVDPEVIPYGTKVMIDGVGVRVAQDCGGSIKGNRIDVYYNNHQDALNSGLSCNRSVWIVNEQVDLIG